MKSESLVEKLKQLTKEALDKVEKERSKKAREEEEEAQKIIDSIEVRAVEQASQGNSHLVVMEVSYTQAPKFNELESISLDPECLSGPSRFVYKYCKKEELHPKLVGRWTDLYSNIHRIDFSLVINW